MVLVATDMCAKKRSRESGCTGLYENIHFQQFLFLTFSAVFTIILILFFKLVYISFLALLSLPLSLFLSLIVYLLF